VFCNKKQCRDHTLQDKVRAIIKSDPFFNKLCLKCVQLHTDRLTLTAPQEMGVEEKYCNFSSVLKHIILYLDLTFCIFFDI